MKEIIDFYFSILQNSISLYKQCQLGQECCSGSCLSFSYRCVGIPSEVTLRSVSLSQFLRNRRKQSYQSDQPQIIDAHIASRGASCQAINEQVSLVFYYASSLYFLWQKKQQQTTNEQNVINIYGLLVAVD